MELIQLQPYAKNMVGPQRDIVSTICYRMKLSQCIIKFCKRNTLVKLLDEYEWSRANRNCI